MNKFDLEHGTLCAFEHLTEDGLIFEHGIVHTTDNRYIAFVQSTHMALFGYLIPALINKKGPEFGNAADLLQLALDQAFSGLCEDQDRMVSFCHFDHWVNTNGIGKEVQVTDQVFRHYVATDVSHLIDKYDIHKVSQAYGILYVRAANEKHLRLWCQLALTQLPEVQAQLIKLYKLAPETPQEDSATFWHADHPLNKLAHQYRSKTMPPGHRLVVDEQTLCHTLFSDKNKVFSMTPDSRNSYMLDFQYGHKESCTIDNVPMLMLHLIEHVNSH